MFDIIVTYYLEIALPIVVFALVTAAKKSFSEFFKNNQIGFRLLPFLPIILGALLGLILTEYSISARLLLGAALGGMSHFLYKLLTVAIIKKMKLEDKMELKNLSIEEVRSNKRALIVYRESFPSK